MIKNIYLVIIILILSCIIGLMSCLHDTPLSPFIDDYVGDYRFKVQWDSLGRGGSDTLEIFTPYEIPFRVIGKDIFLTFTLTDSNNTPLSGNEYFPISNPDTIITVYFHHPFSGALYMHGQRPNMKEVVESSKWKVTVINPFQLAVDSIQGMVSENTLALKKWYNPHNFPDSLRTIWYVAGSIDTVMGLSKIINTNTSDYTLQVSLLDKFHNSVTWPMMTVKVQGFSPVIDTLFLSDTVALGKPVSFQLSLSDTDSSDFTVYAFANNRILFDSLPKFTYQTDLSLTTHRTIIDTNQMNLTFFLKDTSGLKSNLVTLTSSVFYRLPQPQFASSPISIPNDRVVVLRVFDQYYVPGTGYRWQLLRLGIDQIMPADSFSVYYSDTLPDTVIVSGIEPHGFAGPSDTLIVFPKTYPYILEQTIFPTKVTASTLTSFIVNVKSSDSIITDNIDYFWSFTGDTLFDSLYINNDTLCLCVNDSARQFSLSVFAVVGEIDTTNIISATIDVRVSPRCAFTQNLYTTLLGDTTIFNLTTSSLAPIDSVYLQIDSEIIPLGTETQYRYRFTVLDTFFASAWVIDSNGLSSEVDSAQVIVYSNPPGFSPLTGDTMVFINDTIILEVNAYPGNTISSISHYFWDLDGDNQWDDTTTTPNRKIIKTTAFHDTLLVGCINDLGFQALEFFHYSLTVKKGEPVIDTTYIDTNWAYINDPIHFTVVAHDVNEIISSLQIDTNADSTAEIVVPNLNTQQINTIIPISFAKPGTYKLSAWVVDNENQQSPPQLVFPTITIDAGRPLVTQIKPDTVFLKDIGTYTISAKDNKEISTYTWSIDSLNYSPLGIDSSFNHQFKDSGWQYIYAIVIDNENNASRPFKDSVYVIYGAPAIDSVSIDSVWIVDETIISISASDTNGFIDSVWVAYDSDTTVWDTIVPFDTTANQGVFRHSWSQTEIGWNVFWVKIRDDDSLYVTKECSVFVRLGKPHVWWSSHTYPDTIQWVAGQNGDLDTMFYRFEDGDSYVIVSVGDSNGQIDSILWDRGANGSIDYAQVSPILKAFFIPEQGNKISVMAVDEDNIYSEPFTFWVYPDSVPPKSLLGVADTSYDSVTFIWYNADSKDGDSTEFQILCDTTEPPLTVIKTFSISPKNQNGRYYYIYRPPVTGTYWWQVIACDLRGSQTKSNVSSFFDFVKP